MSKEIQLQKSQGEIALEQMGSALEASRKMAQQFVSARLLPTSYFPKSGSPAEMKEEATAKATVAIAYGAMLGMNPLEAVSNLYVMNNKLALYGAGLAAMVRRHPDCKYLRFDQPVFKDGEIESYTVRAMLKSDPSEVCFTYTRQMAESVGLWGGWGPHKMDKMKYKALRRLRDDYFPHVASGVYTMEDIEDAEPEQETEYTAYEGSQEELSEKIKACNTREEVQHEVKSYLAEYPSNPRVQEYGIQVLNGLDEAEYEAEEIVEIGEEQEETKEATPWADKLATIKDPSAYLSAELAEKVKGGTCNEAMAELAYTTYVVKATVDQVSKLMEEGDKEAARDMFRKMDAKSGIGMGDGRSRTRKNFTQLSNLIKELFDE